MPLSSNQLPRYHPASTLCLALQSVPLLKYPSIRSNPLSIHSLPLKQSQLQSKNPNATSLRTRIQKMHGLRALSSSISLVSEGTMRPRQPNRMLCILISNLTPLPHNSNRQSDLQVSNPWPISTNNSSNNLDFSKCRLSSCKIRIPQGQLVSQAAPPKEAHQRSASCDIRASSIQ